MSCANKVNKLDNAQNGRGELLGNSELVTSLNFQRRGNALLKNVGVIWINHVKQIFGDSSIQNVILRRRDNQNRVPQQSYYWL